MKKLIVPILIAMLLYACGSAENKGEKKEKTDQREEVKEEKKDSVTVEVLDTLYLIRDYKNPFPADISKKDKALMKEFFTDSLIAEIFTLHQAYDSIKTEKQMSLYFSALSKFKHRASSHLMDLNASEEFRVKVNSGKTEDDALDEYTFVLDYILNNLKPVNKYLTGLTITCVAECTEPSYDLVLNNLIGLAKETKGEADEKFIQLIIDNFTGEYDPNILNAVWFEQTWDYGGMSLLGSNKHYEFLKATDELIEEKNPFVGFINDYRDECFHDIYQWGSYAYGKEKILKEIKKILKEIKLNEKDRTGIKTRIKELENYNGNTNNGDGLQLNCETGDCAYG